MLVLSSPSGAGKTTISHELLALEPELELSISLTTRLQRESEKDGQDYHFIDSEEFARLAGNDELLEHALVFGNHYGTPKEPVESALRCGKDVLFDIDWQGTQQLLQFSRGDLATVFILPPSLKALEERLKKRAQDSLDVVTYRMSKAQQEISHWAEYEYVIINHDIKESVRQIQEILHAERLRKRRQPGLVDFIKTLHA